MNEKSIQNKLRSLFDNHMYVLTNSFVFSWESDFFSVTKTGTVYEVEVKISKADFKKDFEKEKHNLFMGAYSKKDFIVTKFPTWQKGDLLFQLDIFQINIRRFNRYINQDDLLFNHQEDSFGYWYLRDKFINLERLTVPIYANATHIRFKKVTDLKIPNRFYYACPDGLLTANDVPCYAGLIHIHVDRKPTIVKKAPFLTKSSMLEKLQGVLLDKFWYLSQRQNYDISNLKYKLQEEEK